MNQKLLRLMLAVSLLLQPLPASVAQIGIEPLDSWPDAQIGNVVALAFNGDYAYAAVAVPNGLATFNISDSARPKLVSRLPIAGQAEIEVFSGRLFVGGEDKNLRIYDLADPGIPKLIANVRASGIVRGLAFRGDLLYLSAAGVGLEIYNIADLNNVTRVGVFTTSGSPRRLQIDGDRAYVACVSSVDVLDISNPINPVRIRSFAASASRDVRVRGQFAYVMGELPAGLQIFNIADLANTTLVATVQNLPPHSPSIVYDIEFIGDIGLISMGSTGMIAADFSNPANPVQLTQIPVGGLVQDIDLIGTRLWVANFASGILALDVSSPQNATRVGVFRTSPADATSIHVQGQTGFVTGARYWSLFDLADPTSLRELSSMGSGFVTTPPMEVFPEGSVAYVARDTSATVGVFDISNPLAPTKINEGYLLPNLTTSIAAKSPYAYVITSNSRLIVADASDPSRVRFPRETSFNGQGGKLRLDADRLYIASPAALSIFDVSSPTDPQRLGVFPLPNGNDLDVENGRAYVAARQDGLEIIDVSTPTAPVRLGRFAMNGVARDVKVAGDRAFVANELGVWIVNVADPAQPSLVASYNTFGTATELEVVGDRIFVADGAEGLVALQAREALPQTIEFNPPSELYPGETLDLNAVASSGLAVDYSFTVGSVGLSATKLHALAPGPVTLEAYQAGNDEFLAEKVRRTINVLTPPALTATVGERLLLSWPAAHTGFRVEAADAADAAVWTAVDEVAQANGAVFEVAVPIGAGPRFFRLRR